MQIDIRESIRNNFLGLDSSEIKKSIEDAVNDRDEITLPGLGVFFEILWNNSKDDVRKNIVNTIYNNIKK